MSGQILFVPFGLYDVLHMRVQLSRRLLSSRTTNATKLIFFYLSGALVNIICHFCYPIIGIICLIIGHFDLSWLMSSHIWRFCHNHKCSHLKIVTTISWKMKFTTSVVLKNMVNLNCSFDLPFAHANYSMYWIVQLRSHIYIYIYIIVHCRPSLIAISSAVCATESSTLFYRLDQTCLLLDICIQFLICHQ